MSKYQCIQIKQLKEAINRLSLEWDKWINNELIKLGKGHMLAEVKNNNWNNKYSCYSYY